MALRSNSGDIPPPNGQVLSLVSALSSPENHQLHVQAIQARDEALSGGSYGDLCLQLGLLLLVSDHNPPEDIFQRLAPADLEAWQRTDAISVAKLQQQPAQWVVFGQMAGFILKNALTRPPLVAQTSRHAYVPVGPLAEHLKEFLLLALECQHAELRAVASSIIATCAVSIDSVQPAMHVSGWPQLVPHLLVPLQNPGHHPRAFHGALDTAKKIMEDGPNDLDPQQLDDLVLALMQLLQNQVQLLDETSKAAILQSLLAACSTMDPSGSFQSSALMANVEGYIHSLLSLVSDASATIRQTVCRSLVTLLEIRPDLFGREPEMFKTVSQAMLERTSDSDRNVALEACEYWLTYCSLEMHEDENDTSAMQQCVQSLFPQLLIALLNNLVYGPDEQSEFLQKNAMESAGTLMDNTSAKPVFHKSRAQHVTHATDNEDDSGDDVSDDDDDDDDDDDADDDGGSFWTLRKCAAASLDSLANLFGAEPILPVLWPALEQGLSSTDANKSWIQEACILALGALAEGCHLELSEAQLMGRLHPFLISNLEVSNLPQLQSTAAWTLGRYSAWAVEQVQTGTQGELLGLMTQRLLNLLVQTPHTSVQVATCSAFGVLVESSGDLMAPYLEPIFEQLVVALHKFYNRSSGKAVFLRSLLMLFDTFGILADCCGPAIAEGHLPSIYMPSLMQTWDALASSALQDPKANTLLLPLMEGLASIAVTSGLNFQPYALRSFDNAMCIIEMTTLSVSTLDGANEGQQLLDNEEDYDPIVCSTDLLDGIVEGLGSGFAELVKSSHRYGPHFLSVVHSLCRHDIGGVRMSGLALLGDLARNTPAMLEPALTQLLHESVLSTNPLSQTPSVTTNAVWATGEIVIRCHGNPSLLEPIAESLIQNLLGVLADGTEGLAENAAACTGRLAAVIPDVVAPHLERFFLAGWCEALGKISDPNERRDAYEGFLKVIYLNSNAIHRVHGQDVVTVIGSIVRCIMTWHLPSPPLMGESSEEYQNQFRPFPPAEAKLGEALSQLLVNMKSSVGDETWAMVQRNLPVNARKLLREAYQL